MTFLAAILAVLLLTLTPPPSAAAACSDILQLRSPHVQTSFNETKMTGQWYQPPLSPSHSLLALTQLQVRARLH